jgi:hypothetical protein
MYIVVKQQIHLPIAEGDVSSLYFYSGLEFLSKAGTEVLTECNAV